MQMDLQRGPVLGREKQIQTALPLPDEPSLAGMGIFWRRAAILTGMVGLALMGCAAVLVSEPLFYLGLSATVWGPLLCLFAGVICISRGEQRKKAPEPLPAELLLGPRRRVAAIRKGEIPSAPAVDLSVRSAEPGDAKREGERQEIVSPK